MCKAKKYHKTNNTRIDNCMRPFIKNLSEIYKKNYKILACCCGHKKYPMTVVAKGPDGRIFEMISDKDIPRKRNFYKRDAQGYYYIPEVSTP